MKSNLKTLIALCLIVNFASSCQEESIRYQIPEFQEVKMTEFDIISDELTSLNLIYDVAIYKSYIIVTSVSINDRKVVHIYDKNTGKLLLDAINMGRGPKELLYPRMSEFDEATGTHRFYDSQKSVVLSYQVDSILKNGLSAVNESPFESSIANTHMLDLGDAILKINNVSYLWRDTTTIKRMEILKKEDDLVVSDWNEYPYYDDDRKRFFAYNEDKLALSPDKTRLAVATSWGGVLELYELKSERLKHISTGYYISPDFKIADNGMYAEYGENTLDSFNDLYATDDKIYGAFGGKVRLYQYLRNQSEQKSPLFSDLVVFDWSGKPLQRIHTGHRIERLCIDDNVVYAVIKDSNNISYLAKCRI